MFALAAMALMFDSSGIVRVSRRRDSSSYKPVTPLLSIEERKKKFVDELQKYNDRVRVEFPKWSFISFQVI